MSARASSATPIMSPKPWCSESRSADAFLAIRAEYANERLASRAWSKRLYPSAFTTLPVLPLRVAGSLLQLAEQTTEFPRGGIAQWHHTFSLYTVSGPYPRCPRRSCMRRAPAASPYSDCAEIAGIGRLLWRLVLVLGADRTARCLNHIVAPSPASIETGLLLRRGFELWGRMRIPPLPPRSVHLEFFAQ